MQMSIEMQTKKQQEIHRNAFKFTDDCISEHFRVA